MRVIILGGTGFIGSALCRELRDDGHEIVVLSRRPSKVADIFTRGVIGLQWDGRTGDNWCHLVEDGSAVVNLAGENIADGRWTEEKRERIQASRIHAGQSVMDGLRRAPGTPAVLIQASATGFYGPGDAPADENAPAGNGFLAETAALWEESTAGVEALGVRRCVVRTSMVLGDGGALERMLPPFRLFLGGPVGDGTQPVPWIHLADEVGAIRFLMDSPRASGPYNLVAPDAVDFTAFARTLGRVLHRPSWLRVPGFALRALFGQMADELLLAGRPVRPTRLLEAGYAFRHPELAETLAAVLAPGNGAEHVARRA